jgi:hypothetical protein
MAPSDAARPAVAVTAALPKPGELTTLAPEPKPVVSTEPDIWKLWAANAPVVELSDCITGPAEASIEAPEASIVPDDAAPDATLVPVVTAVEDVTALEDVRVVVDVRLVAEDSGDADDEVDATVDAMLCSAPGIAEVSVDNVCAPVPAEVPAACVTAAANAATPDEAVVCGGVAKGLSVEAADDAPA